MELRVEWLGRVEYRSAWALQHERVAARAAGEIPDTLLLLEHPAVLTLGRRGDANHVLASPQELARRGIELIEVERGGEVTYHGPGQLVAYPIVKLAASGLLLRPFVRALEAAMADTAARYGVMPGGATATRAAGSRPSRPSRASSERLGLRIERGVSYHGIALNVTTRLDDFELIDPCGLAGIEVTSIAREAGWTGAKAEPSTESVPRPPSASHRRRANAVEARRGRAGEPLPNRATAAVTAAGRPPSPPAREPRAARAGRRS